MGKEGLRLRSRRSRAGREARRLLLLAASAAWLMAPAVAQRLELYGSLAAAGAAVEGPASWLESGFGRLEASGGDGGDAATTLFGELAVGLDWRPASRLRLHLHGRARDESSGRLSGDEAGLLEAYVEARFDTGRSTDGVAGSRLRLRLGHFFLPTSQENAEVLWSSPYTLTLSAWNSWIAEEFRPTGLDVDYTSTFSSGHRLAVAGTLFGGNDSAGALLAWRGFSLGERRSVWGEVLPLPPLDSLAAGGGFAAQRSDGTRPFAGDLDDRLGWAGRLRYERRGGSRLQWTRVDSRGDRALGDGEYAWRTRFDVVGATVVVGRHLELVGEVASGSTGMGAAPGAFVDLDFDTAYAITSWLWSGWRLSVRWDRFETEDRDQSPLGENNDEEGSAWTIALFWNRGRIRLGLELVDLDADRPAAVESGFEAAAGGRSGRFEARVWF